MTGYMTVADIKHCLPDASVLGLIDTTVIERFVSDSRQIKRGDCFIALRGERHDAHAFLKEVMQQGASCALISDLTQRPDDFPVIQVSNTLQAIQQLAKAWVQDCQKNQLQQTVAVVGSNGKTTVKGMIAHIFETALGKKSLATQGNLNNEIGLPLTLLRLNREHTHAVLELGMNHPGETKHLGDIAQANIALINNAQREHQEFMQTIDAVAEEHALILDALPSHGVAIFPADSEYSKLWEQRAKHKKVMSFALHHDAVVRGDVISSSPTSQTLDITYCDSTQVGQTHRVSLQVLGEHNAKNALAATAAALAAGITWDAIQKGLETFTPVQGRMQVQQLNPQTTLIDDTYNANPDSVKAAIDVLAKLSMPAWLVLGDMGEVGDQGPAFHEEVGAYAAKEGVQKLFALGEQTKHSVTAFKNSSTQNTSAEHYPEVDTLCTALRQSLSQRPAHEKTTVLVKGSRFMKMERVVKALTEETH